MIYFISNISDERNEISYRLSQCGNAELRERMVARKTELDKLINAVPLFVISGHNMTERLYLSSNDRFTFLQPNPQKSKIFFSAKDAQDLLKLFLWKSNECVKKSYEFSVEEVRCG